MLEKVMTRILRVKFIQPFINYQKQVPCKSCHSTMWFVINPKLRLSL